MKGYEKLKFKAILLRKRGLSYNEIAKKIGVSKSTLSFWLKSVLLKPEYQKRFYTKQIEILSRGSQSQKERRAREVKEIIQKAKSEIKFPLSLEAYRLMGAALYWAEGSKGKAFQMTNSDPYLIKFFVHWVEKNFGVPIKNLRIRLNIYPQQNEHKIKRFWSELTGIPLSNFGKSYVKPFSTGYKKNNLYYGTARVEVPKSADLVHMVFGWIQGTLVDIKKGTENTEKRWRSLANSSRPVNLKN